MPNQSAVLELPASEAGSPPVLLRVAVSTPVRSARMPPAWECSVEVTPLWREPSLIDGEGSFQALCLAARHPVQILDTYLGQGGRLTYLDGAGFDAGAYGFNLLRRST